MDEICAPITILLGMNGRLMKLQLVDRYFKCDLISNVTHLMFRCGWRFTLQTHPESVNF